MTYKRLAVDVKTAAQLLGICKNLAYKAVRDGQIPHVKIGGRILVPIDWLENMLLQASQKGETENQVNPTNTKERIGERK